MSRMFLALGTILCLSAGLLSAQTSGDEEFKPSGKVIGYTFGDYFYKISGDATGTSTQYSNFVKKQKGFTLRRIYLGYQYNIAKNFSGTVLMESNDGQTSTGGQQSFFLKQAWGEWKEIFANHSLAFGLIPTATFDLEEKIWSYRSIEKTVEDFRKFDNSSDMGASLRGKFSEGMFGYNLMVGNGNGQKPENNKSQKISLEANAKPMKELTLEANINLESGVGARTAQKNTTIRGFVAYQTEKFTVGAVYALLNQKKFTDSTDVKAVAFSVFAHAAIPGVDNLRAFARFDNYNPNSDVKNSGYKENFITIGLDFKPFKPVHIMPNIWMDSWSEKTGVAKRKTDTAVRMTFYYIYSL